MWGVALSGAPYLNSVSYKNVDVIKPRTYLGALLPDQEKATFDACMGTVLNYERIYGYTTASNCLWYTYNYAETQRIDGDVNGSIQKVWGQYWNYRMAIGIAKDGRIIYSPYKNKKLYESCDVDICNGLIVPPTLANEKEVYSYVSTPFHPYLVGCYGYGTNPDYYQKCSSNPRLCKNTYIAYGLGATYLTIASSVSVAALLVMGV